MADKGKSKPGDMPKPVGTPKPGDTPAPTDKEEKPAKPKSPQPRDEVGTRKGCRRYRWELKDSNKEFWTMGHAEVKLLSLGCLIAALILFSGSSVHPIPPLIITMELSIFSFFIGIYTFAINRYMPFILWPVSDLLNDLVAFVFLAGAAAYAVIGRETMQIPYFVAVVLTGVAGFFALMDMCLQRKHFKSKRTKTNVLVPPPPKDKAAAPEAAPAPAPAPGTSAVKGKK